MNRFLVTLTLSFLGCRADSNTAGRLPEPLPDSTATAPHAAPFDSSPTLPPGYRNQGGALLGGGFALAFSTSTWVKDRSTILTLDSLAGPIGPFRRTHIVMDVLKLPDLLQGEEVVFVDCRLNDTADASIVALGTWAAIDRGVHHVTALRFAARPDTVLRRFQVLPVAQVTCWYDEDRH